MENLTVGVIGAGGIAAAHLDAWRSLGARIVLWSRSGAGALAAPDVHEAGSVAELLAEVDLVDICTPTRTHLGFVRAAAEAGVHVLCEKPLGRTTAEAEAAVAACASAGVQLLPTHVVRYFPTSPASTRSCSAA